MSQAKESNNTSMFDESKLSSQKDEILNNYSEDAEQINGRWAMIGFVALLGAYISTGQIIPGIY